MNTPYIHENFFLSNALARKLYHQVAKDIPIIDFHNHLDAKLIYDNSEVKNLSECWLKYDHYYWRAMRANGIDEFFITGAASDYDKFLKWCETVPYLLGNPLYHWSHLELSKFFDCNELLNLNNAKRIWDSCHQRLSDKSLSYQNVLAELHVDILCTTNSPLEDLQYHQRLNEKFQLGEISSRVLPTFRADELFGFNHADLFCQLLAQLGKIEHRSITILDEYVDVMRSRMNFFHKQGCRLADLGLTDVEMEMTTKSVVEKIFRQISSGEVLEERQIRQLKSYLLIEFGKRCHDLRWTLQLHVGVSPNINERRKEEVGTGTGFSVMSDEPKIKNLSLLFSQLDKEKQLPKLVLFNLNPIDNSSMIAMCGAFQDSDLVKNKIQYGPAWWFNDHKQGIEQQLTDLKNLGLLGRFIGMTTDSRNMLSLSRHEYFRRILCNKLSEWVELGDIPNDWELLESTVRNICYNNAIQFFEF